MRVPFRHMMFIILVLWVVGRKQPFPFTRFPMYSKHNTEADVIYVTDQTNQPIPMGIVFRTSSSAAKKRYFVELKKQIKGGRLRGEGTAEERAAAGKIILSGMMADADQRKISKETTLLRLRSRKFQLVGDRISDASDVILAELEVKP